MNAKHPIDDLFRRKLAKSELPAPMHLLDPVLQQRKMRRAASDYRVGVVLLAVFLATIVGGAGIMYKESEGGKEMPTGQARASALPGNFDRALAEPAQRQLMAPAGLLPESGVPEEVFAKVSRRQMPAWTAKAMEGLPKPPSGDRVASAGTLAALSPMPKVENPPAGPALPFPGIKPNLISCPPLSRVRGWVFSAHIQAGPFFPHRELSSSGPGHNELLHTRTATENPTLSYGASAGLHARAPFGMTLESGLMYTRVNENFARNGDDEGRVTITTVYGPDGNIIGTDTIREGSQPVFARNSYSMLDLPLLVGYAIHRDKWSLELQGGPSLNLWFQPKATLILDNDHEPVEIQGSEADIFRRNLGISWSARLGVSYRLRDGWAVGISPQVQYYPTSFTRNSYPVAQNYLAGGVTLKLQKQLN